MQKRQIVLHEFALRSAVDLALQAVFKSIGKKASGEKCDAIEGLSKETEGVIEEADGSVARHVAIIGCCQAVEHYEISRCGTLREWAKALGESEAHELLTEILDQEKAANHKLTQIAINTVNEPGKRFPSALNNIMTIGGDHDSTKEPTIATTTPLSSKRRTDCRKWPTAPPIT